jgi:hypothetical protein
MPKLSNGALPEVLRSVKTRPLFQLQERVPPLYVVGQTPNTFRRIGVILGGSFDGERLSGEVIGGGNDWQSVRSDNCVKLDVRLMLKTTDGSLIAMSYHVLRHGPREVMEALDRGETVDPARYYFRLSGLFETGVERYDWINRVIAIGIGDRRADGPVYSIFEVL